MLIDNKDPPETEIPQPAEQKADIPLNETIAATLEELFELTPIIPNPDLYEMLEETSMAQIESFLMKMGEISE